MFGIDKPKAADPGKYLLFLTRPGASPFGGGGPIIMAVDGLEAFPESAPKFLRAWIGTTDRATVITFPGDTPFMLVSRSYVKSLTAAEMAAEDKAAQAEWKAAFGDEEKAPAPPAEAHGMYL